MQELRIIGNLAFIPCRVQPDQNQVQLASILQAAEVVVIEQGFVELDPRRITVAVMLELGPVFHGKNFHTGSIAPCLVGVK